MAGSKVDTPDSLARLRSFQPFPCQDPAANLQKVLNLLMLAAESAKSCMCELHVRATSVRVLQCWCAALADEVMRERCERPRSSA